MSQHGSTNSGAIVISVIVVVLIALGVWWYAQTPSPSPTNDTTPPATTGQLQGTVEE